MKTKPLLTSLGMVIALGVSSLAPTPVLAEASLGEAVGEIVKTAILIVGTILQALVFGTVEDATNKKTCQARFSAEGLVEGKVYREDRVGGKINENDYVCSGVSLHGFRTEEAKEVAPQMAKVMDEQGQATGEFTITDKTGRPIRYSYSATETYHKDVVMTITTINGIEVPDPKTTKIEVGDKRFLMVNVQSRLNLRKGPGTDSDVTGQFLPGDIVEVVGFVPARDDKARCVSGRWALLSSSGAGIGYICSNYVKDAPTGTQQHQVALAQRPSSEGRTPGGAGKSGTLRRKMQTPAAQESANVSGETTQKFTRITLRANVPCKNFATVKLLENGRQDSARSNTGCLAGAGAVGFNF